MLDYKSIIRLKRMGLKTAAIANSLGCKWESVERIGWLIPGLLCTSI